MGFRRRVVVDHIPEANAIVGRGVSRLVIRISWPIRPDETCSICLMMPVFQSSQVKGAAARRPGLVGVCPGARGFLAKCGVCSGRPTAGQSFHQYRQVSGHEPQKRKHEARQLKKAGLHLCLARPSLLRLLQAHGNGAHGPHRPTVFRYAAPVPERPAPRRFGAR